MTDKSYSLLGKRHWSPNSQTYAAGDILLNYLDAQWTLEPMAAVEEFYFAGTRRVEVYHFTLWQDDKRLEMPVQSSPRVLRVIREQRIRLVEGSERQLVEA